MSERTGAPKARIAKRGRLGDATSDRARSLGCHLKLRQVAANGGLVWRGGACNSHGFVKSWLNFRFGASGQRRVRPIGLSRVRKFVGSVAIMVADPFHRES